MTTIAPRLAALRAEMASQKLDAFLVPRSDEYQNEYVPPSAERLAWLTGFTGSAGMALVLADTAALLVDGRYTLQAPDETDTTLFEVLKIPPTTPASWLGERLKAGARVGVDPWLHSQNAVEALRKALTARAIELVMVPRNPLDVVWLDRPAPPLAPAEGHPLEFAGESAEAKRLKLAEGLRKQGLGAFVLTAPDSIAWLLNVRGDDVPHTPFVLSFALLHGHGELEWFVDARKLGDALKAQLGNAVRVRPPEEFLTEIRLLAASGTLLGADPAVTAAAVFQAAGTGIRPAADPCQLPKACKNAAEVAGMRAAHGRDGAALVRFFAWLSAQPPGTVDELTVMARLRSLRAEGTHFRDLSFETIAGSGPNGAIVHYRASETSNRQLQAGELLLLDSGGQYRDGTTDVTRTVAIGTPTDEMRDRFTRVLKGHVALARAVFPKGTTGAQLDGFARAALWAAGLDFDHRTGHGVGSYLSVHEGPQHIGGRDTEALQAGMVVSNEPGYYKTGAYGIRIESLLVVVGRVIEGAEREMLGFETLTLCPIDRTLIALALLSAEERAWLDDYHAEVRCQLSPQLDAAARAWLEAATAPL